MCEQCSHFWECKKSILMISLLVHKLALLVHTLAHSQSKPCLKKYVTILETTDQVGGHNGSVTITYISTKESMCRSGECSEAEHRPHHETDV
jgi:hypothetical protein